MGKFLKIVIRLAIYVLIFIGCVYLYQNQEKILDDATALLKKEKTIKRVNDAGNVNQKYMEEAQRMLYGE